MAKIDLKDLILPVELENTDVIFRRGGTAFNTKDRVFLDSKEDIRELSPEERVASVTDYAVMNGGYIYKYDSSCRYWLRSDGNYYSMCMNTVEIISVKGLHEQDSPYEEVYCIRPTIHLDLSTFISAKRNLRDFGKIVLSKETNKYQIELGEYPKGYVSNSDELEKLYKNGSLKKTGKVYTGYIKRDGTFAKNEEFEYKGKRYARIVCTSRYDFQRRHFADGKDVPKNGEAAWAVVEPIVWNIRNWDELPRQINPKGSGKAEYIDIQTEEGILSGIPFHIDYKDDEFCAALWQNSLIRAYLNGYDLHKEFQKGNGNKEFQHMHNFNFEDGGFLKEAGLYDELVETDIEEEELVM